ATRELTPDWEKYWKDEDTRMIHFIGKDNIVFHCIIFPAMLKHEGSYILPDNVPANEFLNLEGDKISTSRNWAVWLHEYLEDFPGQQDVLRYVLTANAPETKDNDFTWKDFQARNNNELVAILGNFVNRALVLTQKYCNGLVLQPTKSTAYDHQLRQLTEEYKLNIESNLEQFKFREALKELMNIARLGNKYLADTEPWKLIKTDQESVNTILYNSLQLCARLVVLMEPFLPFSAHKLKDMLQLPKLNWDDCQRFDLLPAGHCLGEPGLLFAKIEDASIEAQVNKLLQTKATNEAAAQKPAPAKEAIQYDDFTKLDIRIATIKEAEKVPKADKLLKIVLETGLDTRVVVSGIAQYYKPEDIIGRQVCLLANLAPRKLRGIESQGMILMASEPDGTLKFVSPESVMVNGSTVS
ncbi:MAG: methionine--tRNA ligase subunit beta, partial [Bacteroidales bacterium]|nr:methionine--tRNA ligase subunit beta [Bacteroidales bacterium]